MAERGMAVDRSNIYRWVQKFTPQLDTAFRNGRKRPVSRSWRITDCPVHVGIQILSFSPDHVGRDRTSAYAQERPNENRRRTETIRGPAVLFTGDLIAPAESRSTFMEKITQQSLMIMANV
jgi:hypothetical protein